MSARPSNGAPVNCSGGMNAGVPSIFPVIVASLSVNLAIPKSVIFGRSAPCDSREVSRMLAGLISR